MCYREVSSIEDRNRGTTASDLRLPRWHLQTPEQRHQGQVCKIVTIAERWFQVDPVVPHFPDVGVDSTFYVLIDTAYSHGIINGYGDGTFGPGNNATRGQLSKIIYNAVIVP